MPQLLLHVIVDLALPNVIALVMCRAHAQRLATHTDNATTAAGACVHHHSDDGVDDMLRTTLPPTLPYFHCCNCYDILMFILPRQLAIYL
jgi:hypothetical protein